MAFIDLILLAILAVFLGYRLWLLLGTHDVDRPIRKRRSEEDDLVVPIRVKAPPADAKTEVETPVDAEESKNVDEDQFLQGASKAFHKIVEAYALEDVAVLRKLVEGPLLETFEDAIATRKKAKKTLEVDISRRDDLKRKTGFGANRF